MQQTLQNNKIRKDNPTLRRILYGFVFVLLIALALFTLIPFFWMISSYKQLFNCVFVLFPNFLGS